METPLQQDGKWRKEKDKKNQKNTRNSRVGRDYIIYKGDHKKIKIKIKRISFVLVQFCPTFFSVFAFLCDFEFLYDHFIFRGQL